jgi:hypothetical protein
MPVHKREVMLAQWLKDDKKLRDNAERARDRAINGPRPALHRHPKHSRSWPRMLAKPARSRSHRLEDHGLELRSDSRMCEEYIQWRPHRRSGRDDDRNEFFVTRTPEFFDQIVDEFERVHC